MKALMIVSSFALSAAAIDIQTETLKSLPHLKQTAVKVTPSPQFAAVQPLAHLNFKYSSCAKRNFEADVKLEDGVLFVAIADKNKGDCRGRAVERSYSVQITGDYSPVSAVVVLNPVDQVRPN